ncbi:acyl carrier protein 1, chloroplastic-like protein [Tanacetum coccineum]|uniref:Acyl carrier protein 1, chloroplastic-like protein n=1 Tax=Tanacetum coccineum TaxID=301880 RepID=A0ABQ5BQG2_9ASTR
MENNVYLVEHCATTIGANLGEHISPMERPDKIPLWMELGLLIGFVDEGRVSCWVTNCRHQCTCPPAPSCLSQWLEYYEAMEEMKIMRLTHRRQLEDVPELIHHIQALLPAKDAARTCVLSKSWLHAWFTILTLRFCQSSKSLTKQQEKRYLRLMRRTIRRYHKDNIPIITCDLHFGIRKPKSSTRVEKFIKRVASKSPLKELCLTVVDDVASITLPDEIFSSENLDTLSIKLYFSLHTARPLKKKTIPFALVAIL